MKQRKTNQAGRSMLEMLGVLAIVGILSVGGIFGYNKAVRMYKINKLSEEFTFVMNNLLLNKDIFASQKKKTSNNISLNLSNILKQAQMLPPNWTNDSKYIYDSTHSKISISVFHYPINLDYHNTIFISYYLNNLAKSTRTELCLSFFKNAIIPYQENILRVGIVTINDENKLNNHNYLFGKRMCSKNVTCLQNMTYTDILNACEQCNKNELKECRISFYIDH